METPRLRKANEGYFDWEYFYLPMEEDCLNCPVDTRPKHPHFHCRICHLNLKYQTKQNKISYQLKKHYKNNSTNGHDLSNPPRQVGADFDSLTSNEKTLVREGVILFMEIHLFTFYF